MSFKALQNLFTNTTAYTAVGAAQIALPSSVIAMLTAQLTGGYTTAVSVTDGVNYEVMNIVSITAGAADVERGIDGTTAVPLAKGAQVRFVWTEAGIEDVAPGGAVTCTGAGATNVSGGPNYTIGSQFVQVLAGAGINVTGVYPNFTIENASAYVPVTVSGSGLAVASGGPINYNIDVTPPVFTAGAGISISGVWPNYTITNIAPPSAGTVTSVVAGAGIAVTGTPGILPTVSLSTVGPGAGTYGGLTLNAYGQVTAVAASLLTSLNSATSGISFSGPTAGGVYTINIASAGPAQQGLVSLAPATSPGSNNPGNNTQAVTPAGVNAVVTALTAAISPASFAVAGNQNALSPAAYTNTIIPFTIDVAVLDGKHALIDLYVESYDPVNPTVQQNIGIALFDGGGLLVGVSNIIAGNVRRLQCLIPGPYAQTLVVKTTPLGGTQVIGSYSASVTKN